MKPCILYLGHAGAIWAADDDARAPLALVADFADEAFIPVQLPRARGRDAAALLARRLAQEWPDTPYRLGLRVKPSDGPQGNTHVLAAIPAATLADTIASLTAERREVLGVWSVTLACAWWFRLARLRLQRALVVVRTPSGVRHVMLVDGVPVLSRLILEDVTAESNLDPVQELLRTVQYLRNARWLAAEHRLDAYNWGVALDPEAMQATSRTLEWKSAPRLAGLPDPAEHGAVALFALLQRKRPRLQFAPPEALVIRRARRAARAIAVAASVAASALLAGALDLTLDAQGLRRQRATLRVDIETRAESAQLMHERLASDRLDAHAMRRALTAAEGLPRTADPARAWQAASRAFAVAPAFRLEELQWDGDGANPCTQGDAQAVLRVRGQTDSAANWRTVAQQRIAFERQLSSLPSVVWRADSAPLSLQQAPLRGGGDAPAAQPFSYCIQFGAES